jgi:S1-C subfamily serine protease
MPVLGASGAPSPEPAPDAAPGGRKRRWGGSRLRNRVLVAAMVSWAVVITALVLVRGDDRPAPAAGAPAASPSPSVTPLTVAEVYRTLLPSVVLIRTAGGGRSSANQTAKATSAIGTGVIVNANGTILTAQHVIDGARTITVTYTDGTSSAATVASADAARDIATLTPATLPQTVVPAVLGGGAAVGDPVVAIGNPLGLTMSTTSGVVSGLDRTLSRAQPADMTGLIQFDAAVNPGSSGGPLLNDQGQVVGIVVALANPTDADTFIGIAFAVPIGAALGGGGEGDGRTPPL